MLAKIRGNQSHISGHKLVRKYGFSQGHSYAYLARCFAGSRHDGFCLPLKYQVLALCQQGKRGAADLGLGNNSTV